MHACIHTYTHAHNFYVYMHVILYKNTHTHLYAWPVLPVHRHTFLMYWGNWQVCCMLTNHTMNNKLLQYYKLNLTVWHPCEAHILLLSLTTPPGGITAESTFRGRGVACIAPMSWCSTLHTRVLQLLPPNSFPYDVLTAEVSAVISNDCFREEEEDRKECEGQWLCLPVGDLYSLSDWFHSYPLDLVHRPIAAAAAAGGRTSSLSLMASSLGRLSG